MHALLGLLPLGIEAVTLALSARPLMGREIARSVLRVVVFGLCLGLLGSPAPVFDVRWVGPAALLCGWAIHGGWRVRRAPARRPGRVVGLRQGAVTVLATTLAFAPALLFPRFERLAPTGSHEVVSDQALIVVDGAAPRVLAVTFWYPHDDGRYPLVVFSHGGFGTRQSNGSLYLELASHGYVVAALDHPGHSLWTTNGAGGTTWIDAGYVQALQSEDASADPYQSAQSYRNWLSTRTGDIGAVIDWARGGAPGGAGVLGRVDPDRVAVIGHSLGGAAALAMPRLRDDVDAVIALEAPALGDIVGAEGGAFVWAAAPLGVPVLNVYSDAAWGHLSEWPQYRRNAEWLADDTPDTEELHIVGAGHFALTDLALASPALMALLEGRSQTSSARVVLRAVNAACVDFLDRRLGTSTADGDDAPHVTVQVDQ